MSHDDLERAGFKDRTRVAEALETVLDAISGHDRTERVALGRADGRTLAETVTAPTPVPGYDRAAMDGFAVRAEDTFGASDRSPEQLRVDDAVGPGTATRVHTGSELPPGADAVVMVEQTEKQGDRLTVFDAAAGGENVAPVGEDVEDGQQLYDEGHRLRPSDLGLLKSVGNDAVEVYERPRVSVIPTGEELVQDDPEPGQVIETNGQTVTQYVERWGGDATYRDIVTDDVDALRAAINDHLDHDLVVTTGGSSVGERDLLPEVVDGIGEVLVHGVALKPGHPVALGVVEETPILMLPGYPVACIVNAVQFLRPALRQAGHLPATDPPTTEAELTRKIASEPGTRTYARVELHDADTNEQPKATPTRASGSGVLSSVALADGWVVVPESREGVPEGETVAVEDWEWSA
jgi:molybdopterin molybdotransferase